ncbi:MAG: FTR1 family protein, partial [Corynebacterium kroppenstedtii]|nr:FTR1 family protein [Corynebacterium kroppenstedtii]
GREGMETALFIWATVRSSIENNVAATTTGVVLGLIIAIILGWAVYKGAARINMRMFFAVTGIFLIFVAAGICSYGIGDLQEAGVIPGVMNHAWNISHLLPENTSPLYWIYVVGQAMFQINVQPTVAQVIAWWVYLVPVLVLFILQIRGKVFAPSAPSTPSASARSAAPATDK